MSDRYDAGLLGDFGGGNVGWWQDYIRAELDRAHDFYSAALDAAEAETARAVEAERERCAQIAEGVDAKAFRDRYDVTYTKKRFDQYSHEKGVNNALNIQAEDAAAAIRTGANL